jgi:hypothetical protein
LYRSSVHRISGCGNSGVGATASAFITRLTNCVFASTTTVPPPLNRLITRRSSLCAAATSIKRWGLPDMPSTIAVRGAPSLTMAQFSAFARNKLSSSRN